MKYKALICDVDGTLVPNKEGGKVSDRVKLAIKKAKEKIHVSVATARSYIQITDILHELSLSAPCVITGGAQIINPITKKFYSEKLLSLQQIQKVFAVAKQYDIPLRAADSSDDFHVSDPSVLKKTFDIYTYPLAWHQADMFMEKISHIEQIAVHRSLAWDIDGKERIHVSISHPEATKQYGILEVAEILGISTQEIIGIGEGYNDFPLLMACGFKVAMGNAVEDVKAIADYIAPSVEEDGVADVIEKFIL